MLSYTPSHYIACLCPLLYSCFLLCLSFLIEHIADSALPTFVLLLTSTSSETACYYPFTMPTLSRRQPSLDLRSSARNSVESTNSYTGNEQKLWVLDEEGERHLPEMNMPKAKMATLPPRKQSSRNLYLTTKAELHEQRYQSSEEEASPSPDEYDTGDECGLDSQRGSMCEKFAFEDMVKDDDEVPVVCTARMVTIRVVRPKLIAISPNLQKRKRPSTNVDPRERLTCLDEHSTYGGMGYPTAVKVPKRDDSLGKKLEKKLPLSKPKVKTPESADVSPLSKPAVKHVPITDDYFGSLAPPKPSFAAAAAAAAAAPNFDEYSISHPRPRAATTMPILDDYSLSFAPAAKKPSQSLSKPASTTTSRSNSPARPVQQQQRQASEPTNPKVRAQALQPEQFAAYALPKPSKPAQTFDDYDYSASFAPPKKAATQSALAAPAHDPGWQPPPAAAPSTTSAPAAPLTTSLRTRSRTNPPHRSSLKLSPRASISSPLSPPPQIGTQFSTQNQSASSPSSPAYTSLLGAYGGDPTTPATPTPTQEKFNNDNGGRWKQVRRSMSHLKRMGSPVLESVRSAPRGGIDELVEGNSKIGIRRTGRVHVKDTREKKELEWS